MINGTPLFHLDHAPLDSTVADVTEVLGVLLHTLRDQVGDGGREAALGLLKVLVVAHLEHRYGLTNVPHRGITGGGTRGT